jgi:hypothetical protein
MKLIPVILLAAVSCGGWSRKDTALEAGVALTFALDWHQTAGAGGVTGSCQESNPILGACGERMPVNLYFPVVFALHPLLAAVLPPAWRTIFQAITIGGEGSTTWSNWRAGY